MMRIALALFIGATPAIGAYAACPTDPPKLRHEKPRAQADNCVNLSEVPQISATIVASEPAPTAKKPTYTAPGTTPYEGPTLGFTKPEPAVRATPTIGYRWSLE